MGNVYISVTTKEPELKVLRMYTDDEDENEQYIFSMSGSATFFIDPEDLKKRDFSKVYFYIDFD